ncbi:hypothetical protein NQT69_04125 [Pseudoalteromonas shioyasakiensis]|uniref:hypothetical protein n=1 Tax=Pseudoalteromonas shioyasakiensis TaxID=1190813 RepID=UPI002118C960|nr:hypothetical protein [Pseudoalteromonas shioyasakiensis]MCQ8877227.1 hypothetical protein [Pseudoalteromonas shioyasakiensis]
MKSFPSCYQPLLIIAISSLALLNVNIATASVYQCEKGGVVEFSQFPCGKDAKKITVKEQNPGVPSEIVTHGKMDTTQIDSYIRIKQIDVEIAQHQDKIDTLTAHMNEEIGSLKNQSDAQLNNLTGAKKDTAIANQMVNVTQRYDVQIEREQRDIDRLQKEKLRLQGQGQGDPNIDQSNESKKIDSFIRLQAIKREIAERESKVDTYQAQMNQQIAALEAQAKEQPDNLTDATYDNSLSRKMTALTSKYNTLIEIEQRQIDRLHDEMAQLQ